MLVEHLENPKQLSNPIVFEDAANLAFSIHLMEMSQMTTEGLVGALCQERAVRRPFSQIARRIPENCKRNSECTRKQREARGCWFGFAAVGL